MVDAENNNLKGNAQTASGLKKALKPTNTEKPTFPPLESITDYFERTFNDKKNRYLGPSGQSVHFSDYNW